jgi:predicted regulator of Ras-like GTPase activity (Roadblock/LC7/MglB family)
VFGTVGRRMDAREALAELTELSSQLEAAAVLGADGSVEAATDDALAQRLADVARELLAASDGVRAGGPEVTRVEVALSEGSVFVVREGDRSAVAVTIPEPTAGLVLYDLRTCLRRIDPPRPRRRRTPTKGTDA